MVLKNEGGRVEPNAVMPTPAPVAEERIEEPPVYEANYETDYGEAPPDEEETGGNVYFDAEFAPQPPIKKEKKKPIAAAVKTAPVGDAKATFGAFLRYLRKTGKSGVVFAICMDLDYAYEGDTFVLYTESETIFRSLSKTEHAALIKDSFAGIGIAESGFAIRLRGKQSDNFNKSVEELKATFDGVKIEIK